MVCNWGGGKGGGENQGLIAFQKGGGGGRLFLQEKGKRQKMWSTWGEGEEKGILLEKKGKNNRGGKKKAQFLVPKNGT